MYTDWEVYNDDNVHYVASIIDFEFVFKMFATVAVLFGLLFGGIFAYNEFNALKDELAKVNHQVELLKNQDFDLWKSAYEAKDQLAQLRLATLAPPPIKNLPAPSMAFRYAAMKSPTVEIMISGTNDKGQHYEGHGSGVIVSPNFILTVYHVASKAKDGPAEILFADGYKGKATMVWSDPTRDVAIMALEKATDIKPAALSNSKASIGQDAWSVGYPMDLPLSVQHGEIVSDELKAVSLTDDIEAKESTIYTNLTMGPGDSGGPVFNHDGEVIGLNDFIAKGIGSFSGIVAMQAIIKDVKNVIGE